MRKIKLNTITLSGEEFPIHCDLNVLEQIQDVHDLTVNEFERRLKGIELARDDKGNPKRNEFGKYIILRREPRIKDIKLALWLFVTEGMRVQADQNGTVFEEVSQDYLSRVCDIPFSQLAEILEEEYNRCFAVKKNTPETQ